MGDAMFELGTGIKVILAIFLHERIWLWWKGEMSLRCSRDFMVATNHLGLVYNTPSWYLVECKIAAMSNGHGFQAAAIYCKTINVYWGTFNLGGFAFPLRIN